MVRFCARISRATSEIRTGKHVLFTCPSAGPRNAVINVRAIRSKELFIRTDRIIIWVRAVRAVDKQDEYPRALSIYVCIGRAETRNTGGRIYWPIGGTRFSGHSGNDRIKRHGLLSTAAVSRNRYYLTRRSVRRRRRNKCTHNILNRLCVCARALNDTKTGLAFRRIKHTRETRPD